MTPTPGSSPPRTPGRRSEPGPGSPVAESPLPATAPVSPLDSIMRALVLVAVPTLLLAGLTEFANREQRREALERRDRRLRQHLDRIAFLADPHRYLGRLLQRLATGEPRRLARRLPRWLPSLSGAGLEIHLFDADGEPLRLEGHPERSRAAARRFLAATRAATAPSPAAAGWSGREPAGRTAPSPPLLPTAVVRANPAMPVGMIAAFAGTADAAERIAARPGTLVDLTGGGRHSWGGWWRMQTDDGRPTGHLIAFVHREEIDNSAWLGRAIRHARRQTDPLTLCGWYDATPRRPPRDRGPHASSHSIPPAVTEFLAGWLARSPLGDGEVDLSIGRMAIRTLDNGEVIFAVRRQAASDGAAIGAPTRRIAGFGLLATLAALAGFLAGWDRRVGVRGRFLAWFALAGGIPLLILGITSAFDHADRERSLQEAIRAEQIGRLGRLDRAFRRTLDHRLGRYARFFEGLERRTPDAWGPAIASFMLPRLARSDDVVNLVVAIDVDGEPLIASGNPRRLHGAMGAQLEQLRQLAVCVLQQLQGQPEAECVARLDNPVTRWLGDWVQPSLTGREQFQAAETWGGRSWFYVRGLEHAGRCAGVCFVSHDDTIWQRSFVRRLSGNWRRFTDDRTRLIALPARSTAGVTAWPEPGLAAIPSLAALRDRVLAARLPQHRVIDLDGEAWLVTALRGVDLEGYVLMLGFPTAEIAARLRPIRHRLWGLAALIFVFGLGSAWLASSFLLGPLTILTDGLHALSRRRFGHQVDAGAIRLHELQSMAYQLQRLLDDLRDLELARSVQTMLFPDRHLAVPGCRLDGRCVTASALGGDYYDWCVTPTGRVVFAVGDAAGHGIPAALVVAAGKAEFTMAARSDASLTAILQAMNRGLRGQAGTVRPMTLWIGRFDPPTRRLEYASAGHRFGLLIPGPASVDPVIQLGFPGYPLGPRARVSYREGACELAPGQRLVLYTDGLIESLDPAGEPFGYERFTALARATAAQPGPTAIESMLDTVANWRHNRPADDDQALVLLSVMATIPPARPDLADPTDPGDLRQPAPAAVFPEGRAPDRNPDSGISNNLIYAGFSYRRRSPAGIRP